MARGPSLDAKASALLAVSQHPDLAGALVSTRRARGKLWSALRKGHSASDVAALRSAVSASAGAECAAALARALRHYTRDATARFPLAEARRALAVEDEPVAGDVAMRVALAEVAAHAALHELLMAQLCGGRRFEAVEAYTTALA